MQPSRSTAQTQRNLERGVNTELLNAAVFGKISPVSEDVDAS